MQAASLSQSSGLSQQMQVHRVRCHQPILLTVLVPEALASAGGFEKPHSYTRRFSLVATLQKHS